jgi:hypothetical protein
MLLVRVLYVFARNYLLFYHRERKCQQILIDFFRFTEATALSEHRTTLSFCFPRSVLLSQTFQILNHIKKTSNCRLPCQVSLTSVSQNMSH